MLLLGGVWLQKHTLIKDEGVLAVLVDGEELCLKSKYFFSFYLFFFFGVLTYQVWGLEKYYFANVSTICFCYKLTLVSKMDCECLSLSENLILKAEKLFITFF